MIPSLIVAPNGARKTKTDHGAIPITVAETVDAASFCHAMGASVLHAHVRDDDGSHILDAKRYCHLIDRMQERCPRMIVQITTEAVGIYTPSQQRTVVFDVMPQAASVALREMIADGDYGDFYHQCWDNNIHLQHILYDATDVRTLCDLMENGRIPHTQNTVLYVLGRYQKDQQSSPQDLQSFLDAAKEQQFIWYVCAFGQAEMACLLAAAKQGGHLRIGFENNHLMYNGEVAPDNAAQIVALRQNLQVNGQKLAGHANIAGFGI
ncbi:MAG: 3-keto-5-aminohexanoate cleavage protein [Pseudomonadota bacterium]